MTPGADDHSRRGRVTVGGLTPARKATVEPRSSAAAALAPFRVGHGYDLHRLQPGGKLILAGVIVSEEMSPIAHSDGDVVLHALVDAILGAIGAGDIGELFPNSDPKWKGAPSSVFLQEAIARARAGGYVVSNVDITLLLERPKVGPFKARMVSALRETLGVSAIVNVKAGTNEGCDAIGRGEAVAAHAVVLLAARV